MKKKIWLIPVACIALIAVLWFTGLIPKQIARIAGTTYVKAHFPEMELEYKGVEWADVYGDYLISFEDKDGNKYSCVIGPALFPTTLGQGLYAIEDYYLENYGVSTVGGVDGPELTSSTVQVIEKKSAEDESSYQVGAYLPGTDFSSISQTLRNKINKEWNTYNGMTKEQQLTSSKLWGPVSIQTNSWTECEEILGFSLNNPLESTDWLEKTAYSSVEGKKHIIVTVNTKNDTEKTVTDMYVSAGYKVGDVQITLNANFCADSKTYTTGSTTNGYATFEEESLTTGSEIPVLIVTTDEENNNGYYNGDYYDPVACWVKDNVFYSLRVFGDEADKEDIREVLEKILAEM